MIRFYRRVYGFVINNKLTCDSFDLLTDNHQSKYKFKNPLSLYSGTIISEKKYCFSKAVSVVVLTAVVTIARTGVISDKTVKVPLLSQKHQQLLELLKPRGLGR